MVPKGRHMLAPRLTSGYTFARSRRGAAAGDLFGRAWSKEHGATAGIAQG